MSYPYPFEAGPFGDKPLPSSAQPQFRLSNTSFHFGTDQPVYRSIAKPRAPVFMFRSDCCSPDRVLDPFVQPSVDIKDALCAFPPQSTLSFSFRKEINP